MSSHKVMAAAAATVLLGSVLLVTSEAAAAAPVYHVTTTADSNDGTCTAALCSFRDALGVAENNSGTIVLPAGHYVASMVGGNGVWSPDGQYTIKGAGAHKTIIDGNHLGRTFAFYGQIRVQGVKVTGGSAPLAGCECGGAFEVRQGGALTLIDSIVSGNAASDGEGGGIDVDSQSRAVLRNVLITKNNSAINGGGIHVSPASGTTGTLSMTNVTLKANTATGYGGGLSAEGSVSATNVTFAGNSAATGGAIAVSSTGSVQLNQNTLSGNVATTAAPGIDNLGSATALTARNTIIADTASGDCVRTAAPAVTSLGHNIERGTSCGFTASGDHQNAHPNLAPLASHGGNGLPVFAIGPLSLATNAGNNSTCTRHDERGYPRPSHTRCDIGAYEYQFPGRAKVSFPKDRVRMSGPRKGSLRAHCENVIADRCKVRATLTTSHNGHTLTVGHVSGGLAGQSTGNLAITLNDTGHSLLHDHRLFVTLNGTSANRVGSKVHVHTTLTLLKARL